MLAIAEPDDRAGRSRRFARPQRRGQIDADEAARRRARCARGQAHRSARICASATSRSISSSSSTSTSRRSQHLRRTAASRDAQREQELRKFLGGFGFSGDRVFEPVGPFSGGEKARLVLALVSFRRPNLLLLDEPTNHLDLEMRQALAMALQDYDGAVVLVSHDRHLLRAVADELLARRRRTRGAVRRRPRRLRPLVPDVRAPRAGSGSRCEAAGAEQKKQRKREEAERRNRLSPLRAEVARCETRIASSSAGARRSRRSLRRRTSTASRRSISCRSC